VVYNISKLHMVMLKSLLCRNIWFRTEIYCKYKW